MNQPEDGKTAKDPDKKDDPPVEDPEKDPKPADDPNSETWQHKYKVLQGMFNKESEKNQPLKDENQRLKDQVSRLTAQVNDLTTVTTDLEAKLKEKPAEPADLTGELSEEDRAVLEQEDLGGPVLGVINKLISAAVAKGTAPIVERVEKNEQRVDTAEQTVKGNTFTDLALAGIKRDTGMEYEVINTSTEFNAWLDGIVPFSGGKSRREIGKAASDAGNVEDFVLLFKQFVDETGFKPAASPDNPDPNPEKGKPDPLASELEPGNAGSDNQGLTYSEGRTYTRADVEKFYTDQTKGVYAGREEEVAMIDADILKAHKDGRIVA